jgi:leucyl aminopeptidase (aminopeptidase T)
MQLEDRIKMFKQVFAPKPGEKVLFLVDVPKENKKDTNQFKDRLEMIQDWYDTFKDLGEKEGFTVEMLKYESTGRHNAPLPEDVANTIKKSNLVIAMTEFSSTSTILPISREQGTITRCASMPGVEKRMEDTAMSANFSEVNKYARNLEKMLDNAIGADITFSTGDKLYLDLRYRNAMHEAGDCTKVGKFINFPSGEALKPPYEATSEEIDEKGESKTEGTWPVYYDNNQMIYKVKNNKIIDIVGDGKNAEEMRNFFAENDSRRNIAELGIGCNPKAVVMGKILEDEKVGLHIAYGTSAHLGGKVKSDVHLDIVHAKGCPVEGKTLILINSDGTKTELVRDAVLRYDLLK